MNEYTITVTTASTARYENADIDRILADLSDYAPVPYTNGQGQRELILTVDADTAGDAARAALAAAETALKAPAIAVKVFDNAFPPPLPDLVGPTDAAEILGLSHQRIRQLITDGSIRAVRVGTRALAIPRTELAAPARKRRTGQAA